MRVLTVAPSWIGDSVMAQALFSRLKEHHPECVIDVLAPSWVLPLFLRMEEVRQTLENPFAHGQLRLKERFLLGKNLRGLYDVAYVLPNSFKSALIPFFAQIPQRIGFVGEARYGLLNRLHRLDKKALPKMVERFARLADDPYAPLFNNFVFPHLRAEKPDSIFQKLNLTPPSQGVVVFCPGAEFGMAKRWPSPHFAELAKMLQKEGLDVWLLGSKKDFELAEFISQNSAALNLCGKTTLLEAIDLISFSQAVVCNDSGLMHVASALNRPLVALYGSSSPQFTPPLNPRAEIISLNLTCSPCFQRECPLKHLDCLQKIAPQQVLNALTKILNLPR